MSTFQADYTKHDGSQGTLHLMASCIFEATISAMTSLGDALKTLAVRPA